MITEQEKVWIEKEMEKYDRLPAEMRAAVQEFGELPWNKDQSVEGYREVQQRILRRSHISCHPGLTDFYDPAIQ